MKLRNVILLQSVLITVFSILFICSLLIKLNYNLTIKNEVKNLNMEADNIERVIYAHYFRDTLSRRENDLKEKKAMLLRWGIVFSFHNKKENMPEEIKNALEGKTSYVIRTDYSKTYLYYATYVNRDNAHNALLLKKDITHLKKEYKNQLLYMFISIILSLFIIIPITYYLSKKVTYPITQLIKNINEYKKSGVWKKLGIGRISELGELKEHINSFIHEIDSKIEILKQEGKAKEEFIGKLNHEINTPITSIHGFAELLLKSSYNEDLYSRGLNYIKGESLRISDLNSSLQQLYLPIDDYNWEVIELGELIIQCWDSLRIYSQKHKVDLQNNVNNRFVRGNKLLLFTCIKNILHNSIKACSEGGNIEINILNKNGYVLTIKDNGIGIPEKDIERVKKAYFSNNSSGLGLTICDEIMKYHNGKIENSSKEDCGTTVKLDFTTILHSV